MKPQRIKIWPELISYWPLALPVRTEPELNIVYLELNGCKEVTSCGLTALLLRLILLFILKPATWKLEGCKECLVYKKIEELMFFEHLGEYENPQMQLFIDNNIDPPKASRALVYFSENRVESFPIVRLKFKECTNERRVAADDFISLVFSRLQTLEEMYNFHADQVATILLEIARNSADHTTKDAYFGLDVEFSASGNTAKISFLFGDLGCGIHEHVKRHLIPPGRYDFAGIAETYRIALPRGNTSLPNNGRNFGLGLPKILNYAQAIGMRLSVFDANSRAVLSSLQEQLTAEEATHKNELSHGTIRKHLYDFSQNEVPFCYFGALEVQAR